MTDDEYEASVRDCVARDDAGQVAIAEVYASDGRAIDVEHGLIQFLSADQPLVDAAVVCIGSWAIRSGSWMWSWAIGSMPEGLRDGSPRRKELALTTGRAEFVEPNAFIATEAHVRELAAIGCRHLGGLAVHAGNFDDRRLYFAVQQLTPRRQPEHLRAAADGAPARAYGWTGHGPAQPDASAFP